MSIMRINEFRAKDGQSKRVGDFLASPPQGRYFAEIV